ncbi:hypothetical protein WJX73_005324 [Symbiochloris irregularis]|uniref:Protein kinase domain-containing protein n=1 Tax=Symbiochloris irregularis TaxID=706552 RepID=A0AAW1P1T4_9CHLO
MLNGSRFKGDNEPYGPAVVPDSQLISTQYLAGGSTAWGSADISNKTKAAGQISVGESLASSVLLENGSLWYSSIFSGPACAEVNFTVSNDSTDVSWAIVEHTQFWNALTSSNGAISIQAIAAAPPCYGSCQETVPLWSNTTYQVFMYNEANASSYVATYTLTTYAYGSAECSGLGSAQALQPAFRMPAPYADGFVTGTVVNPYSPRYNTSSYSDLMVVNNASCVLMGMFLPSVYASLMTMFTMHLVSQQTLLANLDASGKFNSSIDGSLSSAFEDPGLCRDAYTAAVSYNATSLSSSPAIQRSASFGNGTLVTSPIQGSNDWNIYSIGQFMNLVNGPANTLGQYTVLNTTNEATAAYQPVGREGFIREWTNNYIYEIVGSSWYDGFGFQGGCARLDFQGSCSNGTSFIELNEFSQWLSANTHGSHVNLGGYSDPLTSSQRPGLVNASVCDCNCSAKMVPLNSSLYYLAVGGTNADIASLPPATQNLTVFAPGSPECANLDAPQLMPKANASLVPSGYFNGAVTNYVPQIGLAGNSGWGLIAAYSNVSCIFLALASSTGNATVLENYGLHLVLEKVFLQAISAKGYLSTAVLRNGLNTVANSFCTGFNCSAAQNQWLPVYNLDPTETYIIIADTADSQQTLDSQDLGFRLVQALSSSDECNQIAQNPQASIFGTGTTNGGTSTNQTLSPATQNAGSSSSTGAIAGGVVGGVVAAALVAALAAFVIMRKRRQKAPASEAADSRDTGTRHSQTSFLSSNLEMGSAEWGAASFLNPHSNPLSAQLLGSRSNSMALDNSSSEVHSGSVLSPPGPANPHKRVPSGGSTPVSDSQWYLDPTTLTVCRHPDGTPWKLGQGGFGAVYKALQDHVRVVAVKISAGGMSRRHDNSFWREIDIIANCRDRNILQFYGAAVHGPEVLLVTEFCERGDLYHALGEQEGEHTAGEFCWYRRGQDIALDIARGLFSLHSRRIVHFDVKSPNVLLTREYLAKIADVGLAHPLLSRSHLTQTSGIKGTWAWQAPETIIGQREVSHSQGARGGS